MKANSVTVKQELAKFSSVKRKKTNEWFFKTGKGQYGEGDKFIGVSMPDIRKVARQFKDLSLSDVLKILNSKIHEERMLALCILVLKFEDGDEKEKARLYKIYLANVKYINNWDLVDVTCPQIVGGYLSDKPRSILIKMAKSKNLWEKRIAIISTYTFIRAGQFNDTLEISNLLLQDSHDLIHKAVGWMLREVGKKDVKVLEKFLNQHYKSMPRTMLRYAIEKFEDKKRKAYLHGKI